MLLETQEAMTVVSKMTKETLEEIDRIAAEAVRHYQLEKYSLAEK